MMRQILSLVLVMMLMSVPVMPVLATAGIEDDCLRAKGTVSIGDAKEYIKLHANTGHKEHTAIISMTRNDFYPPNECRAGHKHHQYSDYIVVKEVCKVTYKCLDGDDLWYIHVVGKTGQDRGLYFDDETLYENGIPKPCRVYDFEKVYYLGSASNEQVFRLYNLMISVDQCIDTTTDQDIIGAIYLAIGEGSYGLLTSLLSPLVSTSSKIPYIGQAVIVGIGFCCAVHSYYIAVDNLHKIDALKRQVIDTAHICGQ